MSEVWPSGIVPGGVGATSVHMDETAVKAEATDKHAAIALDAEPVKTSSRGDARAAQIQRGKLQVLAAGSSANGRVVGRRAVGRENDNRASEVFSHSISHGDGGDNVGPELRRRICVEAVTRMPGCFMRFPLAQQLARREMAQVEALAEGGKALHAL
ncbi:hypothetical protein PsW64_02396 [Pseudovibrio sp. W64]|uniref:hypothetical protein n=1 Tax=Pseudovibrio sp. W64 TaxID=1735583 RepID=UPI0007B2C3E0|nr:hypothetical protein [Pseudovibrio sp. W64]KZK81807.1 hypothetical protein PsW64_02396 [Pseudovibrio sp. W64]